MQLETRRNTTSFKLSYLDINTIDIWFHGEIVHVSTALTVGHFIPDISDTEHLKRHDRGLASETSIVIQSSYIKNMTKEKSDKNHCQMLAAAATDNNCTCS